MARFYHSLPAMLTLRMSYNISSLRKWAIGSLGDSLPLVRIPSESAIILAVNDYFT